MILRLFALLALLIAPSSALAADHAQSAFRFTERRDWDDALLHAKRSGDEALLAFVTWRYALDVDSGAGFDEISRFIKAHPDWPDQKTLRLRAETALYNRRAGSSEVVAWFGSQDPMSGAGKMALVDALMESSNPSADRITRLVREGWQGGDFDESQEQAILSVHRGLLREDDHRARLERLLWEEKLAPAKRLLPRVEAEYQALYRARIALIENKGANSAVAKVSAKFKNDAGLIYDRLRYRARRGDQSGVRQMLLVAPDDAPYPEKWWRYRMLQIYRAVDERNYTLADRLLAKRGNLTDGVEMADATWLSGWLDLEFMDRPKDAYQSFLRMYESVSYPVSRARAAYWAGRAAEKAGEKDEAEDWFETAAAYPTTFYGQLAHIRAYGATPLRIPSDPGVSDSAARSFDNTLMARAVKLCVEHGEVEQANRLIAHMIEKAPDDDRALLAAGLGARIGYPYLSVRGAKRAQQRNIVSLTYGYPAENVPNLPIERPLALAIIRQESEFDPQAKSPAGALGLMQLMPSTAKETSRKLGIGYSRNKLTEPHYNMMLGGNYLSRLIDSYDGSYVLAIAAYNAGPGNVRTWMRQFGTPKGLEGTLLWIEKIPFTETRNYVQRVMENLQVYRHIESDERMPELAIEKDLVR